MPQIVALAAAHAPALLTFEQANKTFFEQAVAPRNADFYSVAGVDAHIAELVNEPSTAAFVLVSGEDIIARANLREIVPAVSAEVGYRVGQAHIGQGIASQCVAFLVRHAHQLQLATLRAVVMDNNPASEKVLVNNGFSPQLCLPHGYEHQGRQLHGFVYQRAINLPT